MPTKAHSVPERNDRLRACKLLISISRDLSTDIFGTERNWGAEVDTCIIGCAVLVGHAEGRPMTAHKLALYLGMPRGTVARKLKTLEDLGVVAQRDRFYFIAQERLDSAQDKKLLAKILTDIAAACVEPSTKDS